MYGQFGTSDDRRYLLGHDGDIQRVGAGGDDGPVKVVVADPNLDSYRSELTDGAPPNTTWVFRERSDEVALVAELEDADVFIGTTLTPTMAARARQLKLVQVAGAGTDGIATSALPAATVLANTFHHGRSIAEYVVMALGVLTRRILAADAALRAGHWASSVYDAGLPQPPILRGSTVGFVGFGNIGSETWSVLRCLGLRGIAVTRSGRLMADQTGLSWTAGPERLNGLLQEADHVVVCLPLTSETSGMIGAAQFALMKPSAVLVNVARGPVVDEQALYEALRERRIAGAAIDVWYQYPTGGAEREPSRLPFASLDNVLMTPHLSGVTTDTFRGRLGDILRNLHALAEGGELINIVARSA
jgi:phosphoglycerate dehydrogenase-like enzyme